MSARTCQRTSTGGLVRELMQCGTDRFPVGDRQRFDDDLLPLVCDLAGRFTEAPQSDEVGSMAISSPHPSPTSLCC
jgi:hypothetical protein